MVKPNITSACYNLLRLPTIFWNIMYHVIITRVQLDHVIITLGQRAWAYEAQGAPRPRPIGPNDKRSPGSVTSLGQLGADNVTVWGSSKFLGCTSVYFLGMDEIFVLSSSCMTTLLSNIDRQKTTSSNNLVFI